MQCNKCQGPTKQKRIPSGPKAGTIVHECTSGCTNDKGYPHAVWPKTASPAYNKPSQGLSGANTAVFERIAFALESIANALGARKQAQNEPEPDLTPDEHLPF